MSVGPHHLILFVLLTVILGACATPRPAPIVERTVRKDIRSVPVESPHVRESPVSDNEFPEPPIVASVPMTVDHTNPRIAATQQLLAAVDNDIEQGNFDAAAGELERALRISPEDAWAWHKLAKLRYAQNDYVQAKATAHRSNALPGATPRLVAANWFLIGDIERINGNEVAATEAYANAQRRLDEAFDVNDRN